MVTFDEVLPTLLRVCESTAGFDAVKRACVVRDLEGRVRLALTVEPREPPLDVARLEGELVTHMGRWFEPPILNERSAVDRRQKEQARLTGAILRVDEPWGEASWEEPGTGERKIPPAGRWHKIERRLSKEEWTSRREPEPPWKLVPGRPAIVTFYSFKGGVGRTTLLAATAWQLAAKGKRVLTIDLDVEAPGLGALLGAETRRGLLDFLVDSIATGHIDLTDLTASASHLGNEAVRVDVLPAGRLLPGYFEKLARLDFVGSGLLDDPDGSPVHRSLRSLLNKLAAENAPDYILLDSRAGLHDVAGLSLHDLAHVDVLVGRDSEQSYQGLELTVAALGRRQNARQLQCVVVQTMAPGDPDSEEYKRIQMEYRRRSWEAFSEYVYPRPEPGSEETAPEHEPTPEELEDESASSEESATAAHYPWTVRYNERLVRFTRLESVRPELFSEDFVRVVERIEALCTPPSPPESEEKNEASS
jgi:MinD-like ATPase involved in chromosome partitioning or flagellar assembly